MKKYKIKITPELIKKLKPYWKKLDKIKDDFFDQVTNLEIKMQKDKKIKIDDLEFFCVEGDYVGIGNVERTMKLIHSEELK